ncbi:MAG: endonuclease domain-containing protein [Acidobacteria bacterium]|nr:endonuclease domain-containing protein [Acidobacteriota bacterium]
MSTAEDLLAFQLRALALPEPVREWHYDWCCEWSRRVHKAFNSPIKHEYRRGRAFRADFAYPDRKLLIEIQGGVWTGQAHGSIKGVLADIERLNTATLAGFQMLRFTPAQVESGEAMETIERALTSTDAVTPQEGAQRAPQGAAVSTGDTDRVGGTGPS